HPAIEVSAPWPSLGGEGGRRPDDGSISRHGACVRMEPPSLRPDRRLNLRRHWNRRLRAWLEAVKARRHRGTPQRLFETEALVESRREIAAERVARTDRVH